MLQRVAGSAGEQWPTQWLPAQGYAKVHDVDAGGAATAVLTINARDVSRWDEKRHAFVIRPGNFSVHVRDAGSSAKPGVLQITA
jgi:hypothetical protein